MSEPESLSPLFDRGIDVPRMGEIRARFLELNQQRLRRARSVLPSRQQVFFDLLPLLFHINHPMLPGYHSQQAPRGIDNYRADAKTLERVQQHIARGFSYPTHAPTENHIRSIFLMGSCGSVGHGDSSDLDVWLCHRSGLEANALQQLHDKAAGVARWAAELGLDVHFFLMDSAQFRRGENERLSADAAGTSQHYLLLDEFYRSAVLVAGRYPVWWLVPPEEEVNYREYVALLHTQGYIGADESIDFGGVGRIPAGEYIGAGIWQLYKAIASPYKAILKLLLTEAYASQFPQVSPLSLTLKEAVYRQPLTADQADPYLMMYQRLDDYLRGRGEFDRLELVRRAFYFKTELRLSGAAGPRHAWRRELLADLIAQWQWPWESVVGLDTRHRWKLRRVREEHRFLVAELTHSYRFLREFAASSNSAALIRSEDMVLLGRKLFAAFERKHNKIEWLNPGIAPDISEAQLYVHRDGFGDQRRWLISASSQHSFDADSVLEENRRLSGLLCWCICNGLLTASSRLRLVGRRDSLTDTQLQQLADHLGQHLPPGLAAADAQRHVDFSRPKRVEKLLIYPNVDRDALSHLGAGLGYQASHYPVYSVELVVINSWGEVVSHACRGGGALLDLLRIYQQVLVSIQPGEPLPEVEVLCLHPADAPLQQHLQGLMADIVPVFAPSEGTQPRYLLKLHSGFYIIQCRDAEMQRVPAQNYSQLVQCLGRGQSVYSPVIMDRHCVPDSALASIIRRSTAADCYLFVHWREADVDVFLRDERGSLVFSSMPYHDRQQVLSSLSSFLHRCREEQQGSYDIHLLELRADGGWHSEALVVPSDSGNSDAAPLHLEAVVQNSAESPPLFDFSCDGRVFRYQDFGADLIDRVTQELFSGAAEHLPYQTLDRLSLGVGQQTSVYWRYKQYLEDMLNAAIDQRRFHHR